MSTIWPPWPWARPAKRRKSLTAAESASRGYTLSRRILAKPLHRPGLSLGEVAGRLGISPRSVQALFEADGTTFSRFVLEERLLRAYRLLTGRLSAGRSVTAVAFEVGFNDLSYFNRTFRRRFGLTPSEARAARGPRGDGPGDGGPGDGGPRGGATC
ncbi:MAG TPA: helix-turn-helix transcriptional regulator [Stellaceae bacterium]|nr:helix-turn-helix transcriptional regulator [Stellaceae bacterium]